MKDIEKERLIRNIMYNFNYTQYNNPFKILDGVDFIFVKVLDEDSYIRITWELTDYGVYYIYQSVKNNKKEFIMCSVLYTVKNYNWK